MPRDRREEYPGTGYPDAGRPDERRVEGRHADEYRDRYPGRRPEAERAPDAGGYDRRRRGDGYPEPDLLEPVEADGRYPDGGYPDDRYRDDGRPDAAARERGQAPARSRAEDGGRGADGSAAAATGKETGEEAAKGKGAAKGTTSLGRASGKMAIGTIASRATGFLRTVAIAAAIGTGAVGDAFNVANTTPNILYDLLLGGILTSVVVPVLVRASKEDPDGGERFASSLLTLMTILLTVAVGLGMLAAPMIINLYMNAGPDQQELATSFLRWFMPQIVFYGLGATIGAILNTRQSFAAPMFTPVLNNLVVIATCLVFIFLPGPRPPTTDGMTDTQIYVLAGGTTLGVVVMTLALLPSLRAVGFRYRPSLDLRHPGLRTAARLAGWTLLYTVVSQLGYLVIVRMSTSTTAYTIYTYGYQIFQLPYAIIGVSVITALLPRMSSHAAQGQSDLVRADLSTATRMTITAILPAALFLLALSEPIAVAVFRHGAVDLDDAIRIGETLSAFAVALVPFSLFQVQLRAFYAHQDSRTPALVNIGVVATNVLGVFILSATVPEEHRAPALALAFAFAYLVGLTATTVLLRRRIGGVDGNRIARVMTRVAITAGAGAVIASVIADGLRSLVGEGSISSAFAIVVAGLVGLVVFVLVGLRTGVHELNALARIVMDRFGGKRAGGQKAGAQSSDGQSGEPQTSRQQAGAQRSAAQQRSGGQRLGERSRQARDASGRTARDARRQPPDRGRGQGRGRG